MIAALDPQLDPAIAGVLDSAAAYLILVRSGPVPDLDDLRRPGSVSIWIPVMAGSAHDATQDRAIPRFLERDQVVVLAFETIADALHYEAWLSTEGTA